MKIKTRIAFGSVGIIATAGMLAGCGGTTTTIEKEVPGPTTTSSSQPASCKLALAMGEDLITAGSAMGTQGLDLAKAALGGVGVSAEISTMDTKVTTWASQVKAYRTMADKCENELDATIG